MFAKLLVLLSMGLLSASVQAKYRYNASDVLKYGLTAHGITYKLRSHRGAMNRWYPNYQRQKSHARNKHNRIRAVVRGNTDCSGLYSAAIRWNGYRHPKQYKSAVGTAGIYSYASNRRHGFRFIGGSLSRNVRHGDGLLSRRRGRGHVLLFNGINARGRVETVEAGGRSRGVGAFATSWSSLARRSMRIVRHSSIYDNVKNQRRVFRPYEASTVRSTYGRSVAEPDNPAKPSEPSNPMPTPPVPAPNPDRGEFHTVASGDSAWAISQRYNMTISQVKKLNPAVDWYQLYIGQKIRVRS